MGEVVPFHSQARRRTAAAPPEGSAQILFFLGVRYVRHEDDTDTRPGPRHAGGTTPRSRRKKRA
jgi:hypothetical protein